MKKKLIALSTCLLAVAGCGGGNGLQASLNSSIGSRGQANMAIHWPKSTRLIPGNAQCIEILISGQASPAVTLTNGTDYVTSPGGGGTSNATTVQLSPGSYTVTAKAWPATTPSGGGSPVAVGSASMTISAGQTTSLGVTMATTIDHIEVKANGTTLEISTSGTVTDGGGGSASSLSLIPTLMNATTIVPKDSSGDGLVLFPASLTGSEVTNGDGKLVVGGATSTLNNTTGSTIRANLIANALAPTSYSSSFTVKYIEGSSTISSFTVPVTMQAVTFGTGGPLSVNAQWTQLNSVSQTSATGYVMIAFDSGFQATGITENIPAGYGGSVGGIAPSQTTAAKDPSDFFWLTNVNAVDVYDLNGTVNSAINGHTGFLALANNVSNAGKPFVIDASGAYEYSGGTPVSTTQTALAGTTGFQFAVGSAADGTYTFYSMVPGGSVVATSKAGVDTALPNTTPEAVAACAYSPLVYVYGNGTIICKTPGGTVISLITVDPGMYTASHLAVYVDPTTGKVDGTVIGSHSGTPFAFTF